MHYNNNYEHGSDDTTTLPNLRRASPLVSVDPQSSIASCEAVRGAGEYLNGENL